MQQLVTCPECKKQLRVPGEMIGTTVQCPECNHVFTAGAADSEQADQAPPVSPKSSRRDEDEDDAPKPSRRRDDDDDDDVDVRRSSRRGSKKPQKVATLGVICLIGGIFAIVFVIGVTASSCGFSCLWPPVYYAVVLGIMAIIRGAGLMGEKAHEYPLPTGIAIMMIINIINLDIVNFVLGIVLLTMCGDEEVKDYLAK